MANSGLQMLGFILAFVGWVGLIISTAMPQWKINAFAGENIVTAQSFYEGLWMTCVMQSTGQMQCKAYDTLLSLPSMIQAARAFMVTSVLLGLIGFSVSIIGMKCMKCMEDDQVQKMRMAILGGILYLVAGLAALVGTSWFGNDIARKFFDVYTPVNARFEFGSALFIGWAAAALTLLGGAFLCCSCPRRETTYPPSRPYPKCAPSSGKDYV